MRHRLHLNNVEEQANEIEDKNSQDDVTKRTEKIWENCLTKMQRLFLPLLSLIKSSKYLIAVLIESKLMRNHKTTDEMETKILSNYFSTFFQESEIDMKDRMMKYIKASLLKLKKIFKIEKHRFSQIYSMVSKKCKKVFDKVEVFFDATKETQNNLEEGIEMDLTKFKELNKDLLEVLDNATSITVSKMFITVDRV